MKTRSNSRHFILLSSMLIGAIDVHAQAVDKPCVELKSEVQVEQPYTDAQGKKTTRLVAPDKVIPGSQVIYIITAKNVCDKPASNVVVNNPMPEHMSYVANSASGTGTDITYSLDNKTFARLDALTVKNPDGSNRVPHAEEIMGIRWVFTTPINAGQTGAVRFRATVK